MINLAGIFPPLVTPFRKEELALDMLRENVQQYQAYSLRGYVVLGSNGERVMLNESESLQVIETVAEQAGQDRLVIFGAGEESVRSTMRFLKNGARAGGQAALLISPHYYRSQMKPAVLYEFYLRVAEASPVPIVIYNVPANTGLEVPVEVVARLAEHPNIIGMKDSSGNLTYQQSILRLNLPDFQLLTGTANTLMPSLVMGAVGGILALANILPGQCVQIYDLVKAGELEQARRLQLQIVQLNRLITAIYGIGGLKFTMNHLGLQGGETRQPLPAPDEKARQEILSELEALDVQPF